MNEYSIIVNFGKGKVVTDMAKLVKNDYNSTKLKFSFDKEGSRYLFKLLFPDNTYWVQEITNNELILEAGVLAQSGLYKYEISVYGQNKKLTASAIGEVYVRKDLVNTDEEIEVDDRIPILDELINEVDNLDIDVEKVEHTATVTLTKKDGSIKTVEIYDGEGGGGTSDYEELENKPSINNVELVGNKSLSDLGIDQDFVKDDNYVHTDNNFTNAYKQQIDTNKSDIDTINTDIDNMGIEIDNLDLNKVPTTRKINNKALTSDITLTPSDIGIGSVFTLKGSKATVEDLPSTGNQIGDVWYVESEEVGYIWLEKSGTLAWEQLGLPIDLSNYVTNDKIQTIETTGESGTFTTYQMNVILANDKNVAISNDGDIYYLVNMDSNLVYRTYISINAISIDSLTYKALYININEEAINYGSWNIEEIILGNNDPVIITALTNTTVNGYQVPSLTTANVQAIYNGIVAGKEVVVVDATENMHFKVNQADSVSGEVFISFLYYDIMLLEYDENATINYKEFASKSYVDNAIGGAIEGSY